MECKRCEALLINGLEYFQGDWVIRCLRCGSLNIVNADLVILGWRKEVAQ